MDIYMLLPTGAFEVWRDVRQHDRLGIGLAIRADTPALAPTGAIVEAGPPDLYMLPVWWTADPRVARVLSGDAEFTVRDFGARQEEGPVKAEKGKADRLPKLPKRDGGGSGGDR